MPESGDSSRKARKEEFKLFKSRRKATRSQLDPEREARDREARIQNGQAGRSRSAQRTTGNVPNPSTSHREPNLPNPASQARNGKVPINAKGRGDVCQLADDPSTAQKSERGVGWLGWFGKKSTPPRDNQKNGQKDSQKRSQKSNGAGTTQPPEFLNSSTWPTQPTQLDSPFVSPVPQSAKQRRLSRQQLLSTVTPAQDSASSRTNASPPTQTSGLNANGGKGDGRDRGRTSTTSSRSDRRPEARRSERHQPDRPNGMATNTSVRSRSNGASSHGSTGSTGAMPLTKGRSQAQSDPSTVVPLARHRSRSDTRRKPRSTDTQVQSAQPTRLQANTQLQQATVLQPETSPRTRRGRAHRSTESKLPTEPLFQPRSRSMAIALYAARMLILSVGVGVLAGTVLSAWNPANQAFWGELSKQSVKQANSAGNDAKPQATQATTKLAMAQELGSLKTGIQGIAHQFSGLTPGIFLIDLDTNNYVDWSGSASLAAASTIKVPVLIAFFQEVDAGRISLEEPLTMTKDLVAQGSGDMQYLPVGAKFSALETATKMITISDNTATNLLIKRLGGTTALNQRFQAWGLSATKFNNLLPDLNGTNTTTAKELASLMVRVSQGELVSLRSRDRILDIMRRTVNNSQLPQGLGEGATIAHKTGDIGTLIGDVGLIDMPSGKRYAMAILVKREFNDDRAYDLIQKVSQLVYQNLTQSTKPTGQAVPAPTPQLSPLPETESDDETQGQSDDATIPDQAPTQSNPVQASAQGTP